MRMGKYAHRTALHQGFGVAYASIAFETTKSEIRNPDGSVVFSLDGIEVPAGWSQVAADVLQPLPPRGRLLAQKYFRKAGVPARLKQRRGERRSLVPVALGSRRGRARGAAEGRALRLRDVRRGRCSTGSPAPGPIGAGRAAISTARTTRAPITTRCATCWRARSPRPIRRNGSTPACTGPMASTARARAIITSISRPASSTKSKSAYEHPQPHACFIQSVADDLVNEGGIMDLWVREARLFKYGSGTGSNFSALRGENEKLSGGGRSSGLMSFLKIGDRAAGAIKSGGTTRRAAKMVVVDVDHPDIEAYIDWKVKEEQKVAALVAGSQDRQEPSEGDPEGLRQLRGPGRRLLQPGEEPGAEARGEARAPRRRARRHDQAHHPVRAPGLSRHRLRHLRHRLGFGSLSHRLRPELQQFGARHRRLPARGRGGRRLEPDAPARRQGRTRP